LRVSHCTVQPLGDISIFTVLTDAKKTDSEKVEEADAEILAAIASRRKLASDMELAKGIHYAEPLKTSCVSPFLVDLDCKSF
jgi:hypothetical protein